MNSPVQVLQDRISTQFPNIAFNAVALVASAGGLKALSTVLSALPADFPAAVLVLLHLNANYRSQLAEILSQRTVLQVKPATTGDVLRPSTVYAAVPARHLLVQPNGRLLLSDAPKMNFVRPAADKLLMSMAATYKSRAIAVVLTGSGTDGALGTLCIKKHGGIAIAQDESTSEHFDMPKAAIATGQVDLVLPLESIAPTLTRLITSEAVA